MNDTDAPTGPVLICFDGSADAERAVTAAARLLGPAVATVLTVWEPIAVWEPYDPGAILSAAVAKLGEKDLGLDEIARELAQEKLDQGVALARAAGFQPTPRLTEGKPWQRICHVAHELDASVIVLGARGLSRVQSALMGGVSSTVLIHAKRPVLVIPAQDED